MDANLALETRRQAPGVAKPLRRHDTDATAISACGAWVAGIAGIIDADVVTIRALDVCDAAAEGRGRTVACLLDGDARENFASLAVGAGLGV